MPRLQLSNLRIVGALAAALTVLLSTLPPAHAEIISEAELINGRTMTQAQCAAVEQAVWIAAMGRHFCMRYFLSNAGGEGKRPVLFLNGDAGKITGDFNTDIRAKYAERMSKEFKTTMIYLGRMGMDGSSGSHRDRHTLLELAATDVALDALKKRHGFEGFHIYGHSGGAWLLGGLLGLRRDIGCAAPADGPMAVVKRNVRDQAQQLIDPSESVAFMARNTSTRILLLQDPQDHIVSIKSVLPFVEKLRKAGGKVEEFYVNSGGNDLDEHHFTTGHSQIAMRDCLQGASHERIAVDLAEAVAKGLTKQLAAEKANAMKTSAEAKPAAAPGPTTVTTAPMAPASASVPPLPALTPRPAPMLDGINLRGADYTSFSIEATAPSLCQQACRADAKCAAWTYVQAGLQGERARCWLKNRVPPQLQSSCCISGIERGEESAAKKD